MDRVHITATIDYETASAEFQRRRYDSDNQWDSPGALELCIIRHSAEDEIRRLTGREPDEFLNGMRELLAPAP